MAGSSLTLVGPGRAGRAFARSWLAAGGRIVEVVARTSPDARTGAEAIGAGTPRAVADAQADTDVLILAVPDDAVAPAASALAGRFRCRAAFHVSGALPAAAIMALRSSGAALGSLHPARVFTGAAGETWGDTLVAVEGDAAAVVGGEAIIRAFGGRPRRISAKAKPLYHAAAAIAAGGTAALVSAATRAWVEAGIPEEEARPALAALAGQAAAAAGRESFERAFTGPVARRDLGTIGAHAEALASRPEVLRLYALLAEETLERTPGRGQEDEVRRLLSSGQREGARKP